MKKKCILRFAKFKKTEIHHTIISVVHLMEYKSKIHIFFPFINQNNKEGKTTTPNDKCITQVQLLLYGKISTQFTVITIPLNNHSPSSTEITRPLILLENLCWFFITFNNAGILLKNCGAKFWYSIQITSHKNFPGRNFNYLNKGS